MENSILIIDDDLMVTRTLEKLLSKQEYSAVASQDGYDAMDKILGARSFDLIICDLKLPGMDGIETIRKIKEDLKIKNKSDVPVIFITGYANSELYSEARNMGKVLVKPFDNAELLETVKEYITYAQTDSDLASYSTLLPLPKPLQELRPSALSVDITNKCNLRCRHCFWCTHKSSWNATTNKDILKLVKATLEKYPTITNITWYGGEPLIDNQTRGLIEQGLAFRKNNLIISNGYFSIPDWHKNAHFAVSIDGTEKAHDEMRGLPGLYKKARENIKDALRRGLPVAVIYCINATNIDCIPAFMQEWADIGLIGIVFTTYVPIRGKDAHLVLSEEQGDKVADLLIEMKKKYGSFIGNTELMIELIRFKYSEELAKNCPMNTINKDSKGYSLHMCNDGNIRIPCAFGMGASHLHCRSITKVALYAGKVLHDRASLLGLFRMYHSKPYSKEKEVTINLTV